MREFVVKELKNFLEIADSIETPFKFYEKTSEDYGRAFLWLRTFMISWEGPLNKEVLDKLKQHGFTEIEEKETRKLLFEIAG